MTWNRGEKNGWVLGIDFVTIDKHALENVIYDVKHGYIPYTGKENIKIGTRTMDRNYLGRNRRIFCCLHSKCK